MVRFTLCTAWVGWAHGSDNKAIVPPADHHYVANPCTFSTALSVWTKKRANTIIWQQNVGDTLGVGNEGTTDKRMEG